MSDMLKIFVDQEICNLIMEKYTHLRYPAAVYAKVVNTKEENNNKSYIIKILDKNRKEDDRFPEIPGVLGVDSSLNTGDLVVVLFMYGDVLPYIVGKVI